MNIVPNRSRMTPTAGRSGDSFVSQLLGVISAPKKAEAELSMYQAKSDIDADTYAKRVAHDTAAKHILGEQAHGHRLDYVELQRKQYEGAGLQYLPHRIGDVESTPMGQAASLMWKSRQEGTTGGAQIPSPQISTSSETPLTSTGPGTNPADVTPIATETETVSTPAPTGGPAMKAKANPKPKARRARNTSTVRKSNVDVGTGLPQVSTSSADTPAETAQPSGMETPRPSRKKSVKPNIPGMGE